MMEHARRVVSNGAPPAESVAEGDKQIAGKPKRGEHKRKRLKTDERGAQLERKKARQTQIASTIRRGSAATDTAVAAGPTIKTKISSKKGRLQKPNKIGVAAEQKVFSSSKGGLGQEKGVERQTSTYRGVSWYKNDNKWQATIKFNGKNRYLGYFENEEEAAKAYDKAARAHHGEKAQLNFPAEGESGSRKSSKYRGVSWHKRGSKWQASIRHNGKIHSLGSFEVEEEAARAYDRAAKVHKRKKAQLNFEDNEEAAKACDSAARAQHGENAQLNFPAEGESGPTMSSKYQGVCWEKRSNKWQGRITYDGKRHSLGYFEGEEEAARAYDRAARAQHGEKAQLNFPA
jgi:hypothetical protein